MQFNLIRPITDEALELITHFEGFYPRPYKDPVGIPTIGIGTIAYPTGEKVKLSDPPITLEKAKEFLAFELSEKADTIARFLEKNKIILNDQQYSALVSFAYNCGCGAIIDSGRSLNVAIKSGYPKNVADAFLLYNKATKYVLGVPVKVELNGLTRRRKAESYLYVNGVNKFT